MTLKKPAGLIFCALTSGVAAFSMAAAATFDGRATSQTPQPAANVREEEAGPESVETFLSRDFASKEDAEKDLSAVAWKLVGVGYEIVSREVRSLEKDGGTFYYFMISYGAWGGRIASPAQSYVSRTFTAQTEAAAALKEMTEKLSAAKLLVLGAEIKSYSAGGARNYYFVLSSVASPRAALPKKEQIAPLQDLDGLLK